MLLHLIEILSVARTPDETRNMRYALQSQTLRRLVICHYVVNHEDDGDENRTAVRLDTDKQINANKHSD